MSKSDRSITGEGGEQRLHEEATMPLPVIPAEAGIQSGPCFRRGDDHAVA